MNIVHITSVHSRNDIRIFFKECMSLSKNKDYNVSLIVADSIGDEIKNNIKIFDIGKPKNRLFRILFTTRKIFKKTQKLNPDIVHFHDPELIPVALKLKKLGIKIIYDVHEDVSGQILTKQYIKKPIRKIISILFKMYENSASRKFDYIVTATPFIKIKFIKSGCKAVDIQNMPIINEFVGIEHDWQNKRNYVCYVGGISKIRGLNNIVEAIKMSKTVKLILAGNFIDNGDIKNILNTPDIEYKGFLKRNEITDIFKKSIAGLVLFLPSQNHINALPNKMFEYMSAGLPVIASDFPLWKEIIEKNNCGICVEPTNISAIAKAIEYLILNKSIAKKMGENGRKLVLEKYNWTNEEKKLFDLYKHLLFL